MTSIQQNEYIAVTLHVFMGEEIQLSHVQKEAIFVPTNSGSTDSKPVRRENDDESGYDLQATRAKQEILEFSQNLRNKSLKKRDLDSFAKSCIDTYQQTHTTKNALRYRFKRLSSTEELLELVFEHAFQRKPDVVIAAAERVDRVSFYPKWKHVCWIKAPGVVGSVLGGRAFKLVVASAAFFLSLHAGYRAYYLVEHLLKARAIPLLINKASLHVIKAINAVWNGIIWVKENRLKIIVYAAIIRSVSKYGPRLPYIQERINNLSNRIISLCWYVYPQHVSPFLLGRAIRIATEGNEYINSLAALFTDAANRQKEVRLAICKEKAYITWKTAIESILPPE